MEKRLRLVWAMIVLGCLILGDSVRAQSPGLSDELQTYLYSTSQKSHQSAPGSRDWLYTGLEINYIVLNAADLITTFYGLDKGAREGNPVARLVIHNRPVAVMFKGGMTAGVLWGLAHVKRQNRPAAYITL
ncbi:MAG TPA: DUF5658 family protein, partial [bacterium]